MAEEVRSGQILNAFESGARNCKIIWRNPKHTVIMSISAIRVWMVSLEHLTCYEVAVAVLIGGLGLRKKLGGMGLLSLR